MTTVNWNQAPVSQPESTLIGAMYQSVGAKAPMVVTDGSSWLFDGCNLSDGASFPNVILGEYDRYVPSLPGPRNLDVLAHSPVPGQSNWSDMTYYTAPGQRRGRARQRLGELRLHDSRLTGTLPSLVIPGPFPDHRCRPPGHGERLRSLRSRPGQLLWQFGRQLDRGLHRRRRQRGLGRGHSVGLSRSVAACTADAPSQGEPELPGPARGGHDTTFGCGPPTIVPQKWAPPTILAPERADRSRGGLWPAPDSPAWS